MRANRALAVVIVVLLAAGLAACAPALPDSVTPGTKVTVGWSGTLTSMNAAADPSAGNTDVAAMVRSGFGDVVDGEFVANKSFGTVRITGDDPFTVRYDLAEPSWSDGTPLDAADLLLGWAGESGWFGSGAVGTAGTPVDPRTDLPVPKLDEFARAMTVESPRRRNDWQSAIEVSVPAHVVGQRAFGSGDAMEAKQTVIRAIQKRDAASLAKIAKVWARGFDVTANSDPDDAAMLSSGPYRIAAISGRAGGQRVQLVPNVTYRGTPTSKVASIELAPAGDDPAAAVGASLDIAQVAPTNENRGRIRDMERKDFAVDATHDGTLWALMLRPAGVFDARQARVAFIHAAPANTLRERGGGAWGSDYVASTSMVTAPGSRVFDIVNEDSGFVTKLGTPADDVKLEREQAGAKPGTRVCVLYDQGSEFATAAFGALREVTAEAGWAVADCGVGTDAFETAVAGSTWDAVILRRPIPQTPAQIAAQWGSEGEQSVLRLADDVRDQLIVQLAETTDVYRAREIRARIEATIVDEAVALPIAANPVITIVDRGIDGVAVRNGDRAPLTSNATRWGVVQK